MSHPINKRERFLAGKQKGLKRVSLWYIGDLYTKEKKKKLELESSRTHRDSTKRCSCFMCRNPRKNGEITLQEKKFLEIRGYSLTGKI